MNSSSNPPTVKQLAQSARASYAMSSSGTLETRLENVQKSAPAGYNVVPRHTNKDMSTFQNSTDPSRYIISHRGTDFSGNSTKSDLKSDLSIVLGDTNDPLNIRRKKRTEKIIRDLRKGSIEPKIHLSSHSLGAGSTNYAMANSKLVRNSVISHDTFNGGSTPIAGLAKLPHEPGTREHSIVFEKSTHHRIENDPVSENQAGSYIGKSIVYRQKREHSFPKRVLKLMKPIIEQSVLGKAIGFIASKAIDVAKNHTISNFT